MLESQCITLGVSSAELTGALGYYYRGLKLE